MSPRTKFTVLALLAASFVGVAATTTYAALYRQRYSSWSHHPARGYYYSSYYYKPSATYDGYKHHYAVYYPAQPRYVYYYNPYRRVYWGRYDLEAKGYSLLDEKDRKAKVEDIPESAFPKPGKMPAIPDSQDGELIEAPNPADLPKADAPADVPGALP